MIGMGLRIKRKKMYLSDNSKNIKPISNHIMFKKITSTIVLLGVFISLSSAQTLDPEVEQEIKNRIEKGVNAGIVVGIIDESGTHYYSYGVKSLKTNEPVDENSVFEIGSISKTFTAILLADNVLKGKMSLKDPVQKYLPENVTAPIKNDKQILLLHIANHTSALPRMPDNFEPANPANPYVDYTEKRMYDFLNNCKLGRDIGSEYEYSNYAMALLGHILATNSNMGYEELILQKIAAPLDMRNTRVVLTENMKKNLASGHSGNQQVENWDLGILAGAGGIRSTAVDMLKYVAANMGKNRKDIYPAMEFTHKSTWEVSEKTKVGLSWHISQLDNGKEVIAHSGATGGYQAYAGFIKGGNKGVVVLTNSSSTVSDIGRRLLDEDYELDVVKPSIAMKLQTVLDKKGIEAGIKTYWELKKNKADVYDFSEGELNTLGYKYMGEGSLEKALAVFDINVKAYPKAFNVYDSRGEAYLKKGDKKKAIADYKRSVELNPANQNGINVLEKLGVDTKDIVKEVKVEKAVLESYIGKYELDPRFVITITLEGEQLMAQATGQSNFPVFPKSENVFYYKVVQAELTFNKNEKGEVESLTLFQSGHKMTGKRIED